ncbi:MAG TPA: tetratricopeptide repeat protein, partial [Spongiibacteraceae bacterium]|nr:tetratricopeptide repeat protein [Spongiibacteraceae bacterium]
MTKIGRNDPCPCGSGKKHKQCCMRQDGAQPAENRPPVFNSAQYLQLAFTHHRAGRAAEAELLYRKILATEPKHAEALHLLGVLAGERGDYIKAIESIEKAIAIDATNHTYHGNLGNIFTGQNKPAAAEACFRRALALKPDSAHYDNLAGALRAQNKFDEAIANYRQALAMNPGFLTAQRNLGDLLQHQGRYEEAISCYRQVLVLDPGAAEAHGNLGAVLKMLGRGDEAMAHYRQALALKPDLSTAHSNLGGALLAVGDLDNALECYRNALALGSDYAGMLDNDAEATLQDLIEDTLLYIMSIHAGSAPLDYLQAARRYGEKLQALAQPYTQWLCAPRATCETLRVGLVSADFRDHPVGYFLENILAHLDATKIELLAYATDAREDAVTLRLKRYFSTWQSLVGLSNERAAQKIHADAPHILIDLNGCTANNRLPVFAWKPAPIQVSWLGYWASTGLAAMDYILADPYSILAHEAAHYSERPWYLPDTRLCFTPPQETMACAELPALTNGRITFGCFNNPTKMNEAVVALWTQVLQRVPGSRLVLKAKLFEDTSVVAQTHARFAAHGIDAARLTLLGQSARADYLAAYNAID